MSALLNLAVSFITALITAALVHFGADFAPDTSNLQSHHADSTEHGSSSSHNESDSPSNDKTSNPEPNTKEQSLKPQCHPKKS